ncbi:hypothetical protein ALP61_05780, partial [Pseudomonas savastanoi]
MFKVYDSKVIVMMLRSAERELKETLN